MAGHGKCALRLPQLPNQIGRLKAGTSPPAQCTHAELRIETLHMSSLYGWGVEEPHSCADWLLSMDLATRMEYVCKLIILDAAASIILDVAASMPCMRIPSPLTPGKANSCLLSQMLQQ